jgi:hypothetical protein
MRYNSIAMTQLTRDQFNARLANGLFDDGKRCRIVGRDEEAELEWCEDYRLRFSTAACAACRKSWAS